MGNPVLRRLALGVALLVACHRTGPDVRAPSEEDPPRAEDLAGLELPLRLSGGVRAAVNGDVGGRPAEVVLELAQPMSSVARGCFPEGAPKRRSQVRFPDPRDGAVEAPVIVLSNLTLGGKRLGSVDVALLEGEPCVLVLGSDVLGNYALAIDPASRTLAIVPARDREAWLAEVEKVRETDEAWVLDVGLDPMGNWPLLAFRAVQSGRVLIGPAVLSTGSVDSELFARPAARADFRPGAPILRELGVPAGVDVPQSLGGDVFGLDSIELAPKVAVKNVAVKVKEEWGNPATIGLIGGDVWGRFRTVFDAHAGVLFLRRPKVTASPSGRPRCALPGREPNEESCFELHQRQGPGGLEVAAAVWRDLPLGARVDLDLLGTNGEPVGGRCRVGLTFSRTDRGTSSAHQFPWPPLVDSLPGCAEAIGSAKSARFSLWEEDEAVEECPGTCAFVHDLDEQRISCQCHGAASAPMGEGERRLLEKYREKLQRTPPRTP